MSEDWLDTGRAGVQTGVQRLVEGERGEGVSGGLPAVVELPVDPRARLALVEDCWRQLSELQRLFLTAWRDNRYNATRASEQMGGKPHRKTHERWLTQVAYGTIVKAWLGVASDRALDKDRLIARQDDIVETLLTPKPVLHQGIAVLDPRDPTGTKILEEIEAGAASKANEVLLRAGGHMRDKDVEVNVGIVTSPLPAVRVRSAEGVTVDATPPRVVATRPVLGGDWLDC